MPGSRCPYGPAQLHPDRDWMPSAFVLPSTPPRSNRTFLTCSSSAVLAVGTKVAEICIENGRFDGEKVFGSS